VAVELATAYLSLVPSLKGAQGAIASELGGLGSAGGVGGKALGGGLVSGLKGALGPVAAITAGVFGAKAVYDWGKEQLAALARIETINAQTTNVIQSTGGAAGVTADHVADLAGALELTTATEGEAIQEGANLLLTFKNIRNEAGEGNDIFDQTTTAMVDMARAMGTDAQGGAIQLGKALNDPIKGISALSRVGITFTDDQKELITTLTESGKVMEAQKIILAELNSQFGGSGAAYAETYAGRVELLGHAWGNFGETVFQKATPALGAIAKGLTDTLNNHVTPFTAGVIDGLTGIKDLLVNGDYTGLLEDSFGWTEDSRPVDFVLDLRDGLGKLLDKGVEAKTFLGDTFSPVIENLGDKLGPVVPQVVELWEAFSPLGLIVSALAPYLPALATGLADIGTAVGDKLGPALSDDLLPALGETAGLISDELLQAVQDSQPEIEELGDKLLDVGTEVLPELIPGLIDLVRALLPLIPPLVELALSVLPPVIDLLTFLVTPTDDAKGSTDGFTGAVSGLVGVLVFLIGLLPGPIPLLQGLRDVMDGTRSATDLAGDAIGGKYGSALAFVTPKIIGFGTMVGETFRGIQSNVSQKLGQVQAVGEQVWGMVPAPVRNAAAQIGPAISAGITQAVGFIAALPGRAVGALGNVGTTLRGAGGQLVDGFVGGMLSGIERVAGAAARVARAAVDAAKNALDIHSPSRVMRDQVGVQVPAGIAEGILSNSGVITAAMSEVIPVPDARAFAPAASQTYAPGFRAESFEVSPGGASSAIEFYGDSAAFMQWMNVYERSADGVRHMVISNGKKVG
jgi:phage-related protein